MIGQCYTAPVKIPHYARQPRRYRKFLFDDLSPEVAHRAEGWFSEFYRCHRDELATKRWLYPVLIGQARRLAMTTPEERSQWARRMRAKLGGLRVQQLYREQGRTGAAHPAHKAARVSAARRRMRKEEKLREAMGLPPKPRHKWLPIA